MSADDSASGTRLLDHEQPPDGERPPRAVFRDQLRDEPAFPVERGKQLLNVKQARLHLHDQEGTRGRVPGEDVDRSTLAIVTEGELDPDFPRGPLQERDERLHEPRVSGVEQARHLGRGHPWLQLEGHPDRNADARQQPERGRAQPAAFDERDRRLVDARGGLDIGLSPPAAVTRGANEPADSAIIHRLMIVTHAYRPITDG